MNELTISRIIQLLLVAALALMPLKIEGSPAETDKEPQDTVYTAEEFDENDYTPFADWYRATVATVGGDGYEETILYQNADGGFEVHFFSNYEYYETEQHHAYRVDSAVLDELYAYVEQCGFAGWNDEYSSFGLTGAYYVFRYRSPDGEIVRVTSDCMPDNGLGLINGARVIMSSYVSEENRLY